MLMIPKQSSLDNSLAWPHLKLKSHTGICKKRVIWREREREREQMASVTMAASLFGGAVASPATAQRRLVITNSSSVKANAVKVCSEQQGEGEREGSSSNNGRREIVFAAAAAALCSVAGVAMAEGPKRGTPQAKKAFAPVCVANPTARICNY